MFWESLIGCKRHIWLGDKPNHNPLERFPGFGTGIINENMEPEPEPGSR